MKNLLIFIYFVFLGILLQEFRSLIWALYTLIWLALGSYVYKNNAHQRKIIFGISSIYPLIETIIKITLTKEIIKNSWVYLNTTEHFLWSLCFTALIFFLFLEQKYKIKNWVVYSFLIVGIANLAGVGNEIIEYFLREIWDLKEVTYYADTIKDLLVNLAGSMVGFLLCELIILRTSIKKQKNKI